jgi:site-specific DNA-methyltransferase (adenine-specific)
MVTPPNGIVLDPFVGSGTTGIACKLEGFNFVGMEQDPEYAKIAEGRINNFVPENEDLPEQKSNELTQGELF